MTKHPAQAALVEALADARRNGVALGLAGAALGSAVLLGTDEAYFGAGLVVFTVWMGWFVLTAVEWLRRADF